MDKRGYYRKTLILKQETESFLKEQPKTAVATIEVKNGRGKVTVKGEGLSGSHAYLVGMKKGENRCVDLGLIGSVFDPNNVSKSGMEVQAFDILVVGKADEEISFPWWSFIGYMDKKREWRRGLKTGINENVEVIEEINENVEVVEEINENVEVIEESVKLENVVQEKIDTLNALVNKESLKEELIKKEEALPIDAFLKDKTPEDPPLPIDEMLEANAIKKEKNQEEIHEAFRKIVKNFSKEMKDSHKVISVVDLRQNSKEADAVLADKENSEVQEVLKEAVDYMFETNQRIMPFKSDESTWIRVSTRELWALPIDHTFLKDEIIAYSFRRYNHLLLSRYENGSIFLAIPDFYSSSFRVEVMKLGAVDFRCDFDNPDECYGDGTFGYWILKLS